METLKGFKIGFTSETSSASSKHDASDCEKSSSFKITLYRAKLNQKMSLRAVMSLFFQQVTITSYEHLGLDTLWKGCKMSPRLLSQFRDSVWAFPSSHRIPCIKYISVSEKNSCWMRRTKQNCEHMHSHQLKKQDTNLPSSQGASSHNLLLKLLSTEKGS